MSKKLGILPTDEELLERELKWMSMFEKISRKKQEPLTTFPWPDSDEREEADDYESEHELDFENNREEDIANMAKVAKEAKSLARKRVSSWPKKGINLQMTSKLFAGSFDDWLSKNNFRGQFNSEQHMELEITTHYSTVVRKTLRLQSNSTIVKNTENDEIATERKPRSKFRDYRSRCQHSHRSSSSSQSRERDQRPSHKTKQRTKSSNNSIKPSRRLPVSSDSSVDEEKLSSIPKADNLLNTQITTSQLNKILANEVPSSGKNIQGKGLPLVKKSFDQCSDIATVHKQNASKKLPTINKTKNISARSQSNSSTRLQSNSSSLVHEQELTKRNTAKHQVTKIPSANNASVDNSTRQPTIKLSHPATKSARANDSQNTKPGTKHVMAENYEFKKPLDSAPKQRKKTVSEKSYVENSLSISADVPNTSSSKPEREKADVQTRISNKTTSTKSKKTTATKSNETSFNKSNDNSFNKSKANIATSKPNRSTSKTNTSNSKPNTSTSKTNTSNSKPNTSTSKTNHKTNTSKTDSGSLHTTNSTASMHPTRLNDQEKAKPKHVSFSGTNSSIMSASNASQQCNKSNRILTMVIYSPPQTKLPKQPIQFSIAEIMAKIGVNQLNLKKYFGRNAKLTDKLQLDANAHYSFEYQDVSDGYDSQDNYEDELDWLHKRGCIVKRIM